jgi:hypothetical protein
MGARQVSEQYGIQYDQSPPDFNIASEAGEASGWWGQSTRIDWGPKTVTHCAPKVQPTTLAKTR